MAEKTQKIEKQVGIKNVVDLTKTEPKLVITKKLPHEMMVQDIANTFAGKKPVIFHKIVQNSDGTIAIEVEITTKDEKTTIETIQQSDFDGKKVGATFATIKVKKDLASDMLAKHRETGEDNPYTKTKISPQTDTATEKYTVQVLGNCIWQNVVDNARVKNDGIETKWEAQKNRNNAIETFDNCRFTCHKMVKGEKRYYVNYIVLRYLSDRVITNNAGEILDQNYLDGFMKQSKAMKKTSRAREAEKHGLSVEVDPQNRQMKLSNIESLRILGIEYIPQS